MKNAEERRGKKKALKTTLLVSVLVLVSYKTAMAIVGLLTFSIKDHPVAVTIFFAVCAVELLLGAYVAFQRQKRINFYRKTIKIVKTIKKKWAIEMNNKDGFIYRAVSVLSAVVLCAGAICICFLIILPIIIISAVTLLFVVVVISLLSLLLKFLEEGFMRVITKIGNIFIRRLPSST